MRGHRRADEPRRRERDREQDGGALRRLPRRRCRSGRGRRRDRRRPGARQRQVERDADDEMKRGPAEARAAPAEVRFEQGRERPADRAREAGDQRDAGDRTARAGAVEPDQRGERGFVEAAAHADAEHRPGEKEAPRSLRERERGQPGGEDEVGSGEDEAAAPAIDRAAGVRAERGGDEQRRPRTPRTPSPARRRGRARSASPAPPAGSTTTPRPGSARCRARGPGRASRSPRARATTSCAEPHPLADVGVDARSRPHERVHAVDADVDELEADLGRELLHLRVGVERREQVRELRRISGGVDLGTPMPRKAPSTQSTPSSLNVGTSGQERVARLHRHRERPHLALVGDRERRVRHRAVDVAAEDGEGEVAGPLVRNVRRPDAEVAIRAARARHGWPSSAPSRRG